MANCFTSENHKRDKAFQNHVQIRELATLKGQ